MQIPGERIIGGVAKDAGKCDDHDGAGEEGVISDVGSAEEGETKIKS